MLLASLLAAALCAAPAAPVVVVMPFEAGPKENLGRALANLLEDDLRLVPGLQVRTRADLTNRSIRGKPPSTSHLVRASLLVMGGATSVSATVVRVADQRVLAATRTSVKGGEWNLARVELVTAIAKALLVLMPEDYAVEAATAEQLEAWGAALKLVDEKAPKAKGAVQDLVKRWPDFGPAVRLLGRL